MRLLISNALGYILSVPFTHEELEHIFTLNHCDIVKFSVKPNERMPFLILDDIRCPIHKGHVTAVRNNTIKLVTEYEY